MNAKYQIITNLQTDDKNGEDSSNVSQCIEYSSPLTAVVAACDGSMVKYWMRNPETPLLVLRLQL